MTGYRLTDDQGGDEGAIYDIVGSGTTIDGRREHVLSVYGHDIGRDEALRIAQSVAEFLNNSSADKAR